MRVAVFTDMDLDAMNGVTTRLRALVRWAPSDVRPRIYTRAARLFSKRRPSGFPRSSCSEVVATSRSGTMRPVLRAAPATSPGLPRASWN
jgi:hypothetical protein